MEVSFHGISAGQIYFNSQFTAMLAQGTKFVIRGEFLLTYQGNSELVGIILEPLDEKTQNLQGI